MNERECRDWRGGMAHLSASVYERPQKHFEIWGDELVDAMCELVQPEDEEYMEARLATTESIRNLLDPKRWEGLYVFVNAGVKERRQLYVDIMVSITPGKAPRGYRYIKLSLWPEPDHWRVIRHSVDEYSKAPSDQVLAEEVVLPQNLKRYLGLFKAEMRQTVKQ